MKNQLVQGSQYIHQIKWDGIRGITYMNHHEMKIRTKNNTDVTSKYPELEKIKTQFTGQNAVLDGEMVVLDKNGKPDFYKILKRHMIKTDYKINYYVKNNPVLYIIFDLLYLNNQDLRPLAYEKRKELLQQAYKNSPLSAIADDFEDGHALFELMKEKKMEGIVSKDLKSPYVSGKKHGFWFKTKIKKKMLVVIGGLKLKNNMPVSLLVGIYSDQQLQYIGSVSSGLTQNDLYLLKDYISDLKADISPFYNDVQEKDIVWFKPLLTCTVGYFEKSNNGHLRHPEIIGFSNASPDEAIGEERIYEC